MNNNNEIEVIPRLTTEEIIRKYSRMSGEDMLKVMQDTVNEDDSIKYMLLQEELVIYATYKQTTRGTIK